RPRRGSRRRRTGSHGNTSSHSASRYRRDRCASRNAGWRSGSLPAVAESRELRGIKLHDVEQRGEGEAMSLTPRQRVYGRGRIFRYRRRDGSEYGNYVISYYVGGREQRESTRTTDPREAIRLLNDRLGHVVTGQAAPAAVHRITVADLLADRLAMFEGEDRASPAPEQGHVAALCQAFKGLRAA